ncbi:hypothetical protein SDC9_193889 [bioreactor metagenome]|uniref:Uncharacterized protein n=1 Tax=bioreactor metagenome TaxID=1076179 RepID=A0A645IG10_9ZZZZ
MAGGENGFGQRFLFGKCAKGVLQGFNHPVCECRVHLPDWNRAGTLGFMGVCHIEIVFKPPFAVGIVQNGNTAGTLVDPAVKLVVPLVQLQYGGGVGALGVD